MSQRALAVKLGKPASYVHKCEVAERKLDPLEFLGWIEACKIKPSIGLATIDMFRRKSSI